MILGATPSAYASHPDLRPSEPAWFCRYCRSLFPSRGQSARECPTPGCDNPYGFGRFADTPRPKHNGR